MKKSGLISLADAMNVFRSLPGTEQIPSLQPGYIEVDALRDCRLKPIFWLYSDASFKCLRSFHVVTTTLQSGLVIKDIEYPYGYGGVICTSRNGILRAQAHQEFCAWAHEENILVEFCRIHPILLDQKDFFLEQRFNRDVVLLDLTGDFFSGYRKKRRWTIRKELKKDIQVICAKTSSERACFRKLYDDTMKRAGASEFYSFNDQYFDHLFELDSVKLWLALYNGRPLSGAIVLESEMSGIIEYHLGAYAVSSEDQPMVTLLHLIASHYGKLNFKYFYLGGGRSADADDSLLKFKTGFTKDTISFNLGFNIFDRARYESLLRASNMTDYSARILFYRD